MTEIPLNRRSTPDRLRYLAGKLDTDHGDQARVAVIIALEAMADELEQPARPPGSAPGHD